MAFQIIAQLVMLLGTVYAPAPPVPRQELAVPQYICNLSALVVARSVTIFKIVETSIFSQGFALLGLSVRLQAVQNSTKSCPAVTADRASDPSLSAFGLAWPSVGNNKYTLPRQR